MEASDWMISCDYASSRPQASHVARVLVDIQIALLSVIIIDHLNKLLNKLATLTQVVVIL